MRYVFLIAGVLILAAAAFSAGCIGENTPEHPSLAGDPAVGVWTGNKQTTQICSDTGEIVKISRNHAVTIREDGSGTVVSHVSGEIPPLKSIISDSTVSKTGNVYMINWSRGTSVMTVSDDGSAVLTTPAGLTYHLTKSEA